MVANWSNGVIPPNLSFWTHSLSLESLDWDSLEFARVICTSDTVSPTIKPTNAPSPSDCDKFDFHATDDIFGDFITFSKVEIRISGRSVWENELGDRIYWAEFQDEGYWFAEQGVGATYGTFPDFIFECKLVPLDFIQFSYGNFSHVRKHNEKMQPTALTVKIHFEEHVHH